MIVGRVQASSRPLADLVIVNYRSYEELSRCLSSLEPLRGGLATITVVDQESDSAAAAAVARAFPWAVVIERQTNDGFAQGINAGATVGHAPFLLLLNPDCVAGSDFVARLVDFAVGHPQAAIVGPRILNADGTIQGSARRFPGWSTFVAGRSSWLTKKFPGNPLSRWNLPGRVETSASMNVDWVSGACMLVRRSAFDQVGGMDEAFFLYWEDADLCKRLTERGWLVAFFPGAEVVHVGGRSSIHVYRESLAAFHASAFRLFWKHSGWVLRGLAPLVYGVLQARLHTLLYVHRNRLSSARLTASHRSSET
jgi:GT2 family glycosyltransferase